jgi:hypothetical protein
MVRMDHDLPRPEWQMARRKKERTTALVVSAVLAGFRAIDTGSFSAVPHVQLEH